MMEIKVRRLEEKLRRQESTRTTEAGSALHDWFAPAERYAVDFAPDFNSEGWQQFDTDQDAEYFGVWLNPEKLLQLCSAEGDWTLTVCADRHAFNTEVRAACEFYGQGFIAHAMDDNGQWTTYRQDRSEFLIGGESC